VITFDSWGDIARVVIKEVLNINILLERVFVRDLFLVFDCFHRILFAKYACGDNGDDDVAENAGVVREGAHSETTSQSSCSEPAEAVNRDCNI
jgi:hypothetical protein